MKTPRLTKQRRHAIELKHAHRKNIAITFILGVGILVVTILLGLKQ